MRWCVFKKGDPRDNLVGGVCVGGKGSKAQYVVILIFEFNKFEFSRSGVRNPPPPRSSDAPLSLWIRTCRKIAILFEAKHKENNFL